ncbi:trichohyalin-like [Astyanax mexicanus]|uniref:Trichohyalin-like n=1 Tax=Astyanax mexicanus TaxID=7994 RepID=A0A8T2KRY3_ASTMX|nr:trichohyalin-like [Astyanax mexicanus]
MEKLMNESEVQQTIVLIQKIESEKRDRILQAWTVASKEWMEEKKKMKQEIELLKQEAGRLRMMKKKDGEVKDLEEMRKLHQSEMDLLQKKEKDRRDRILKAWTDESNEWDSEKRKMRQEIAQLKEGEKLRAIKKKKDKEQVGEMKELEKMRELHQKEIELLRKTDNERRDRVRESWLKLCSEWKEEKQQMKLEEEKRERLLESCMKEKDEWKEKMETMMKEREKEKKEMESTMKERKEEKETEKMRKETEAEVIKEEEEKEEKGMEVLVLKMKALSLGEEDNRWQRTNLKSRRRRRGVRSIF